MRQCSHTTLQGAIFYPAAAVATAPPHTLHCAGTWLRHNMFTNLQINVPGVCACHPPTHPRGRAPRACPAPLWQLLACLSHVLPQQALPPLLKLSRWDLPSSHLFLCDENNTVLATHTYGGHASLAYGLEGVLCAGSTGSTRAGQARHTGRTAMLDVGGFSGIGQPCHATPGEEGTYPTPVNPTLTGAPYYMCGSTQTHTVKMSLPLAAHCSLLVFGCHAAS